MEAQHQVTLPIDLEALWPLVTDPRLLAQVVPALTVTEVEDRAFRGTLELDLEGQAATFAGTGTYLERRRDEVTATVVVDLVGSERRGRGNARARLSAILRAVPAHQPTGTGEASGEATEVDLVVELSATGGLARWTRRNLQGALARAIEAIPTAYRAGMAQERSNPTTQPDAADEARASSDDPTTTTPAPQEPAANVAGDAVADAVAEAAPTDDGDRAAGTAAGERAAAGGASTSGAEAESAATEADEAGARAASKLTKAAPVAGVLGLLWVLRVLLRRRKR